jgi:hypothetical protein
MEALFGFRAPNLLHQLGADPKLSTLQFFFETGTVHFVLDGGRNEDQLEHGGKQI